MSVVDQVMSTTVVVGMAATMRVGSDTYGVTVVEVSSSGHTVKVRHEKAYRGGLHVVDVGGEVETFTRRKDGRYRRVGTKGGVTLHFGKRVTYADPSF